MQTIQGLTRRAALLSGVAAAFPARAAAPGWEDVVAKAKTEGQVLLYSTKADADNARLLDAFMKKYPDIKAKSIRLVGGAMISRIDQELQAGALAVDVALHSENQWSVAQARAGKLVLPAGPSVALWKGAEPYYQDGTVQVTAEPWVIGYNTRIVKTAPTDWDSLLTAEQYKGRVGLNEVSGLTVAIWFDFLDKHQPGYLEKLVQLHPRIYPNSAPLTAGMTSGEIVWAPYSLASTIEPLKAKKAPIEWVFPASGTWSIERRAMVLKGVPHPNAALVLLDYLMSQDGQQVLNTDHAGYTVAPGITITGGIDVDLKKITPMDYTSYPADFTRMWQEKVDRLYRA
jgi:iron(III) transport system substrate-binding protein